ncbi:mismatch repair endonuclease [Hamiltosporidium tvaerminnensis]|uniref:Mismatch repair endonuclease n=1 Tax=Hamiltosporidium tvaerminnensis TaxID=1176355 RepID=A0A4Q9L6D2_9MICR|nr:ATP-binding mismatch repair protein [Hamiltosporidium tvaerminnensis]TBU02411.1 mismatch repair endonuclease [Hamiltosporidium tvaerminnensis]
MIHQLSTFSSETIQSQQTFTNIFSITKELIENSLDAESTIIKVFIDNLSIKIEDNGIGINTIEKIGIEGFTTKSEQTHYVLGDKPKPKFSFGFRGQAIFLLRKICDIEIISRESSVPYALKYNLSKNTEISKTFKEPGTTIIVTNIFKNCPIRRKIFYSQISKDTEKLISLFKSYCIVYKTEIKLFLKNKLIFDESGFGNIKKYFEINFPEYFNTKNKNEHGNKNENVNKNQDGNIKDGNINEDVNINEGKNYINEGKNYINEGKNYINEGKNCINEGKNCINEDGNTKNTKNNFEDEREQNEQTSEFNSYIEFENENFYFLISKISSVSLKSFIFVDLRPVKSKKITKQICQIFNNFSSNFPIFFLKIKEDSDVNVSADKTDFVLANENNIFNVLRDVMERNLCLYKYVSPMICNYEIEKQEHKDYKEINNELRNDYGRDLIRDSSKYLQTHCCAHKNNDKESNTKTFFYENLEKFISNDSLENEILTKIDENKDKNYKISEKNIFSRILNCKKPKFNDKNSENFEDKKSERSNVLNEKSLNTVNNKIRNKKYNRGDNISSSSFTNEYKNEENYNESTEENIFISPTDINLEENNDCIPINHKQAENNCIPPVNQKHEENNCIPPVNHKQGADNRNLVSANHKHDENNNYIPPVNHKQDKDNYKNIISQDIEEQIETPNPFYIEKTKNIFLHFDDPIVSSLNTKIILTKKDFLEMKIIGQFNCGFILTELIKENKKYLIIIDQHAADEIKNFEFLKNNFYLKKQRLIVPLNLKLDSLEEYIIKSNKSVINRNGFEINNNLQIICVPIYKNQIFGKNDFYEILSKLKNTNQSEKYIFCDRIKDIMASKACRQSIMIGDVLSYKQMEEIVRNLTDLNIPWNCPHGRPTTRVLCVLEHKN